MSTTSSASKPSGAWQPPPLEEMQAMLPQYEFVSLLGRGGMGAVFKAVQVTLDRPVAIKVLPVDLVADEDTQFAERFKNEARTMAKMNHPAIVNVYDFGETNTGLLYIVMEFIDGTDVAQMIASQGKLPEDYALSITAHVSDALNYAHTHGIVHRDIKPANILINMEGAVKVADFGLAKANDPSQSGITKTNMAMGTPDFVAPEAFIPGIPLDGRADLYAMGVMLYQMLTGEIPRGIWTMPSAKLGTDPRFDSIIAKAMQTDREQRYQSAVALRQDLDTILTLPRAALIQQQQAAAEAAARATQAKKQTASGPQRRPVSAPLQVEAPLVKRRSSLGPVFGIAASVVIIAGLFYLLRGPKQDKSQAQTTVVETPAGSAPLQPKTPPTTAKTPPPAPKPAAPKPAAAQASGEVWVDGLSHILADPKQSKGLSRQPDGSALVTASCDLWPMPIDGAPMLDQAVRITGRFGTANLNLSVRRTENGPNGAGSGYELKWLPGTDRLPLGHAVPNRSFRELYSWNLPPGTDLEASHSLELRVVGDQLSVSLDGREVGDFKNAGPAQGFPHMRIFKGAVIEQFEYADLGRSPAAPVEPLATTTAPVMPPAPMLVTPAPMPVTPATVAKPAIPPGWTDLLATADVARDTVQGRWEMREEGLHCAAGGGQEYFKFPPPPGEEYDYLIEFTLLGKGGTVSQMLVVPGHQFALLMSPEFSSLGAALDGKLWDDPERTEALSREPGHEPGRRVRAKVEVRRGAARVIIDDREVINWSGDFKRLELHTRSYNRNHKTELGVACQNAEVVFHRVMVGPPSVNEKLVAQLISSDPRIARLDAGFKSRYESDVEKPRLAAVAALNKSYVTNGIAKARAAAQSRGSLKEVVAFDEVKARIERGEGVPDLDEPDAPESLKSLRAIYRSALAKITAESNTRATPLYDIYLKALDAYIAELKQAEKIPQVETVTAFRDDLARQRPDSDKPATATVAVQEPVPTTPAASPAPAASSGSSWRRAAEWLVAGRGSAYVVQGGQRIEIKNVEDIPSGRFDFDELNLRGAVSTLKLTDADTAVLSGMRDLRRVLIRANGLTDDGFAFLDGNADLEFLFIEISPEITDGVLVHLADATKLREFRAQGAKKFTGRGMDRAPFLDSLQAIFFNDSGISDEGLRTLADARQLASLDLSGTNITDKGCAALNGMKSLKSLIVQNTAFGDEAAAIVAKLSGLQRLNVQNSKITEAGLAKLSNLKNLVELVVRNGNPQLSEETLVEFQKSMPSCKVH